MNSLKNRALKGLENNNKRLKTDKLALSLFSLPLQRKGLQLSLVTAAAQL